MNYYNEFDPHAAAWLRELIAAGHIAPGDVDTRSIEDVTPNDLRGYTQCHFFAGIGGWAYALDLAGWSRDRPVWTGSCPCQPFSAAGKGAGFEDERHLWPAWQHLIAQCRPPVVFGEQVASAAVGPWLDLVQADLEGLGYAFGSVASPASGIGAPHIRDRTYWLGVGLADTNDARLEGRFGAEERSAQLTAGPCGVAGRMAHSNGGDASAEREQSSGQQRQQPEDGGVVWLGNATGPAGERNAGRIPSAEAEVYRARSLDGRQHLGSEYAGSGVAPWSGALHGFWRDADWLGCRDGKWRPVEPGSFPLAHGLPVGMGKLSPRLRELASVAGLDRTSLKAAKSFRTVQLRGYGNAIVPQQAAEFVKAYCEAVGVIELAEAA